MKIAFLQETFNQSIGVMYLSALARQKGHEPRMFIEPLEQDFLGAVEAFKPDLVGFSVITGAHRWALRTAEALKKRLPQCRMVAGGPHPTYFPEMVAEGPIDCVARGESESSFPVLLEKLAQGKPLRDTLGFWVKEDGKVFRNGVAPLVEDLSSLPYPDHELYRSYQYFRDLTEVPFSTTRGCPFNCSFCYNHVKASLYKGQGKYVRLRRVDEIIGEMETAKRLYPRMRSVILYDDIIGVDRPWLREFCAKYTQKIDLPWFTSIRADFVDKELARLLKGAHCFCLSLGLESGDEELRAKVLCKRIPNKKYLEAAAVLKEAGIKIRTSNMLFLPGEDLKKALSTVDLNRQMKVDFAWAYTMQPYPGTQIFDHAMREGLLPPGFQFDDIDPLGLIDPIVRLKDARKILVVHRFFYWAITSRVWRALLNVLVRIPPNPLFDACYYFSLIHSYAQYHQVSIWRALGVAWTNYWGTKR